MSDQGAVDLESWRDLNHRAQAALTEQLQRFEDPPVGDQHAGRAQLAQPAEISSMASA